MSYFAEMMSNLRASQAPPSRLAQLEADVRNSPAWLQQQAGTATSGTFGNTIPVAPGQRWQGSFRCLSDGARGMELRVSLALPGGHGFDYSPEASGAAAELDALVQARLAEPESPIWPLVRECRRQRSRVAPLDEVLETGQRRESRLLLQRQCAIADMAGLELAAELVRIDAEVAAIVERRPALELARREIIVQVRAAKRVVDDAIHEIAVSCASELHLGRQRQLDETKANLMATIQAAMDDLDRLTFLTQRPFAAAEVSYLAPDMNTWELPEEQPVVEANGTVTEAERPVEQVAEQQVAVKPASSKKARQNRQRTATTSRN